MENKNCFTLGDLKKYIAACTLPDKTPLVIARMAREDKDGGHDVEAMALESIGENGGKVISFTGFEGSLTNNDLLEVFEG